MTRPEEKLTPETIRHRMGWLRQEVTDGGRRLIGDDTLAEIDAIERAALASVAAPGEPTDEAIMAIVCREVDALDCTRVSEREDGRWKATTIFDGDAALLRCLRAVLALAAPSAPRAGEPTPPDATLGAIYHDGAKGEPELSAWHSAGLRAVWRAALSAAATLEPNTVAGTQPGNGEACAQSQPTVPAAAAPEDAYERCIKVVEKYLNKDYPECARDILDDILALRPLAQTKD